jgi:predicted small lipoprotein YifL
MKPYALFLLLSLSLVLAGCGQPGPLYLPGQASPVYMPSEPAPEPKIKIEKNK